MFFVKDKYVLGMAGMRVLSGLIELSAALLMLKLNRVDQALKVNAVLALVGPTVMMVVTALGVAGLAGKVSFTRMMLIILGVGLVFYGVRRG
ncbi:hypothetical protein SY88_08210 [Clostridiales bacterium PH28_bin88]|nr:hypothetical protein SY88_08210 [Clostridiales bacterium PH28_bin88]